MNDDLLEQLQADVHAVLLAFPGLSTAKVILDNKGDLEGNLGTELATVSEVSGKGGLAVIVLAAVVDSALENLPGPEMEVTVPVQCIELVELNRSEQGTGIRSSTAALRVLRCLQHFAIGNRTLYPDKGKPLQPFKVRDGFVSHIVTMRVAINCEPVERPPAVTTEEDGEGNLILSAGGHDIHWTVDGSFPTRQSVSTNPILLSSLAPGTLLRACAISALGPGDLLEFIIPD